MRLYERQPRVDSFARPVISMEHRPSLLNAIPTCRLCCLPINDCVPATPEIECKFDNLVLSRHPRFVSVALVLLFVPLDLSRVLHVPEKTRETYLRLVQ